VRREIRRVWLICGMAALFTCGVGVALGIGRMIGTAPAVPEQISELEASAKSAAAYPTRNFDSYALLGQAGGRPGTGGGERRPAGASAGAAGPGIIGTDAIYTESAAGIPAQNSVWTSRPAAAPVLSSSSAGSGSSGGGGAAGSGAGFGNSSARSFASGGTAAPGVAVASFAQPAAFVASGGAMATAPVTQANLAAAAGRGQQPAAAHPPLASTVPVPNGAAAPPVAGTSAAPTLQGSTSGPGADPARTEDPVIVADAGVPNAVPDARLGAASGPGDISLDSTPAVAGANAVLVSSGVPSDPPGSGNTATADPQVAGNAPPTNPPSIVVQDLLLDPIPTPEPDSLAILGAAIVIVLVVRRRALRKIALQA
jgi:hypothetical protein